MLIAKDQYFEVPGLLEADSIGFAVKWVPKHFLDLKLHVSKHLRVTSTNVLILLVLQNLTDNSANCNLTKRLVPLLLVVAAPLLQFTTEAI